MNKKIRILDKSKKCNRRCSSCKYWEQGTVTAFGITKVTHHWCNNRNSDEFNKEKNYWNCCKYFTWDENIVDKNDITSCEHVERIPLKLNDDPTPLCMYYFKVQRQDGKYWNHFPVCLDKHCPIKHPELLCGEDPL